MICGHFCQVTSKYASDAHHTLTQWLSLPNVQALLDPSDAVDEFIEMARLDARALPGATG